MKALSLRQPWAWAVLHAGKRVENRRWSTRFRGEILIHAAKGCTAKEYEGAVRWMLLRGLVTGAAWLPSSVLGHAPVMLRVAGRGCPEVPPLDELERGGIVGRARIVDVLPPSSNGPRAPWHMPEQYGFVLEDVTPLPFRPYRGSLQLFNVEEMNP